MDILTIIGLGAGELDQLSIGTYRKLKQAPYIIARTAEHPVIEQLSEEGITMASFDDVYESHDTFEVVYKNIVAQLLELAKDKEVTYVVPGHPLVAEQTVQLLIAEERAGNIQLQIEGGNSFLDPMFAALRIDPIEGFQLVDGTDFHRDDVRMTEHVLIGQVYDSFIASEVKLSLMEKYTFDHEVTIVTAAGTADEKIQTVPLFELDRVTEIDNLTTVYVPPVLAMKERLKEWTTFRSIIAQLRGPDGCPWDREQTHATLTSHLIEEAHELVEAIENEDYDEIIEELGDVLLQVFLHAQIGEDDQYFSIEDILEAIGKKMIRRHPHVFANKEIYTADDVVTSWQEIKAQEREQMTSVLENQLRTNSSLLTAYNYQKEAAKVGFDWSTITGAFDKFSEEWEEFKIEVEQGTTESQLDELGDVLFTLVNIARFLKLSPEEAMVHANQKFQRRFTFVEKMVGQSARKFSEYTLDELEAYWQLAKREEVAR